MHVQGLHNLGKHIDMESLLGSQIADKQFSYIYTDFPFFVQPTNESFSRFLMHQAAITDYKQKFSIKDIIKIWSLMSPSASVNLKICSLSFNSLEYQEENEDLHFISPLEILKYLEERNEKKFTFLFSNGPKKKQFTILMNSNLHDEEKKRLKVLVDLSQPDSSLSLI